MSMEKILLKYEVSCILCGAIEHLCMTAHRNKDGKMVGWVFACSECQPKVADKFLHLLSYSRPDLVCPECRKLPDQCDCPLTSS